MSGQPRYARGSLAPAGSADAAPPRTPDVWAKLQLHCGTKCASCLGRKRWEGWSGANGAVSKPTPALYLCSEGFHLERSQLAIDLDAPGRKADLDT